MPTVGQVKEAMKRGVGFTCATCDHFWWGVQHGLPMCKAKHEKKFCAGPMSGGAFPQYAGTLKGAMTNHCFACGKKADAAAEVRPLPQSKSVGGLVGVCYDHVEWLETYSRPAEKPPFVTHKKTTVLE